MISRYAVTLIILCLAAGAGVFELKHSVAAMRDRLALVEHDIREEQRQIQTLAADWAHVTRPDRLVDLAREVGMVRANVLHVVKLDNIGRRAMLEMARYSVPVPLSESSEGIFRVKPPVRLSLARDSWPLQQDVAQ